MVTSVPSPSSKTNPDPIVFVVVILPPKAVADPSIVILELESFPFSIDPFNIALVIPLDLTRRVSLLISMLLSSTLTLNTLFEADNPAPANNVTTSAKASFLVAPVAPPSKKRI